MGDFNDRCTNWTSDHKDSEIGLKLVNLYECHNLTQLIDSPTRGDNVLDLLATDAPAFFTNVDILDEIAGLDHKIIHGSMSILRPEHKQMSREVWLYDQGNYDYFNGILLAMNWDEFFSSTEDINLASKLPDPNTSSKTFWKITKLVYGTKRVRSKPHLIVNDCLITKTTEKAETFNQYFTEQCKLDPTQNDPLPEFIYLTDNKIETLILTLAEIYNILKKPKCIQGCRSRQG